MIVPADFQDEYGREAILSAEGTGERFGDVLARRLSRRGLIRSGLAASAMVAAPPVMAGAQEAASESSAMAAKTPAFTAIAPHTGDETVVAEGYRVTPLVRWGDPLTADAPVFDPLAQTAAAQAVQAGYNCDFTAFLPLPQGSNNSDHGLLVINHEFTIPELMFPGYLTPNPEYTEESEDSEDIPEFLVNTSKEIIDTELAAHGLSVVEIKRDGAGSWSIVRDSRYNRRITGTTPTLLTGPAAGAEWMKTAEDPTGTQVIGTLNNCAGGVTPWGTIISGEENFNFYFGNGKMVEGSNPVKRIHARYSLFINASQHLWETAYDRFDLGKEPNEPLRFGWAIEFDPYDPASTPKKRTALGRNKHEGHTSVIAPGRQVAIYSGDDERFEYAYKFVTAGSYNPDDRAANLDLCDEGTLYVARFNDDGTGDWLPLVAGDGDLTAENGFPTQAEVLINTRGAADLLGATKMDRPEDFEANPVTGKVYLILTNNSRRGTEDNPSTDAANPRTENGYGHIIEITEDGNDHAATTFTWDIFMLCGNPEDEETYFAGYPKEQVSAIACPDNITFDRNGNLWIATDGQPHTLDVNDGLFATPVEGPERGYLKQFFAAVPGAECSGPSFNPDNTALFISVQHPGEGSTLETTTSRWPDGGDMPPRPSVVVITKDDGGPIGS